MRQAAHDLADLGWRVLPLHPGGKTPLRPRGVHDATTDHDQIDQWWLTNPTANIGGAVPDGHVVVDVDVRHQGKDTLDVIQGRLGVLPVTTTVLTGSGDGSFHTYYTCPLTEGRVQLGRGVDIRWPGKHYCLLPPSHTEHVYGWKATGRAASLPASWVKALRRPTTRNTHTAVTATNVEAMGVTVAVSAEGSRNNTLFWAACRAFEAGIDDLAPLIRGARESGLETWEIENTLRSASRTVAKQNRTGVSND